MPHAITQVLDAVVTAVTGLATTGARVFKERPRDNPLAATELDALRIWESGEEAGLRSTRTNVWYYGRTPTLYIEAVTKRTTAYGDQLRQIALEVETAIGTPLTIAGKQFAVIYRGCEMSESAEGDQPVATRLMRFEVHHISTASNAPGSFA